MSLVSGTSLRPTLKRLPGLLLSCPKSLRPTSLTYDLKMSGKKDYFPNNWKEYKDADDSDFIPHTFEEIMSWKVAGWELPNSICCIIRVTDIETKKVKELVYQKRSAAKSMAEKLINTPGIEFTVVDHESIHHLTPVK